MKKIRWGVIGAGGIARRRTIPEGILAAGNAELVAVGGGNPGVCREVAEKYSVAACPSVKELLATEIDAVYVATPTYLHHQQVIEAAQAGKHVLCEKPLATNLGDGKEMVQACRRAGVKLSPAFMMRFHPAHQKAREMVGQGRLGTPVSARAQLSCWFPPLENNWRQIKPKGGGGCVPDLAAHCLDLLGWIFGSVVEVSALCGQTVQKYADESVEDTSCVLLKFESGALGIVDTYFSVPDSACENVLELYGSKGAIKCKGTLGQEIGGEMIMALEREKKEYDAAQHRNNESSIMGEYRGGPSPYQFEIEAFSHAILTETDPPISDADALVNLALIEAIYQAKDSGKTVQFIK